MAELVDASKDLPRDDPQYEVWVKYLATENERTHRFDSSKRSAHELAIYLTECFDQAASLMLKTIENYSSAIECSREIDRLARVCLACFQEWIQAALPKSKMPSRSMQNQFCKQLLRRAEHHKAEAHARVLSISEEQKRPSLGHRVSEPDAQPPSPTESAAVAVGKVAPQDLPSHVAVLSRILGKQGITLERWAANHRLGRTTVFDWKAALNSGKALKGRVSGEKSAAIEQAIEDDAEALGLPLGPTRTSSD